MRVRERVDQATKVLLAGRDIAIVVLMSLVPSMRAQTAESVSETSRVAFEVASIRADTSEGRPISDFPIGPGRVYVPRGGLFRAKHVLLIQYIGFAYDLTHSQETYLADHVPEWVLRQGFDITARVEGRPSEDRLRGMMRSLLEERFKLAIHKQGREIQFGRSCLGSRESPDRISCSIRLIHPAHRRRRPLRRRRPFQEAFHLPAMRLLCFQPALRA